ncbi:MAG: 1-deoxy-D-xylulose-5-phosphate synthase [Verrucomicrobia bacterium]|nr:1-deoxy-D-xylulose-5-phosphate synthase [Verrucomicrobiota bacterium]
MSTSILDTIQCPADVKKLSIEQLTLLAQEIRHELVEVLSQTGGHLGPNLGVVELTIAMHAVFDCPKDRFTWDVSHQGYVHKLLTGRREAVKRMRQFGGACGFLMRSESEFDHFGAGHAGTALSAALGMATARDMKGSDEHVVAVVGDAALTCGVTYEALNNVAQYTKRLIVVLNDNKWSIAKNVGAIAAYLNKIVTHPTYNRWHKKTEDLMKRLHLGEVVKLERKAEGAAKGLLVHAASRELGTPAVLFEEMGLNYYGPIDGHNLKDLIQMLTFVKNADGPVVLHILTEKGRGFKPAMEKPEPFHGCGKFDPDSGEFIKSDGPAPFSSFFADAMIKLAETNSKLCCITGAMPSGTGLSKFAKAMPQRFFDVGIAEEHAVLFAAGLASNGFRPVCAIYSTFLQRAYDMIIHDVCLQNLPVMFCLDRGGCVEDGPTHHGIFDIAYLRPVPNIIHMQPKDEDEFQDMLYTMLQHPGPSAIRYPREPGKGVSVKEQPRALEIGKAEVIKHGDYSAAFKGRRAAIWGLGNMLGMALEAAKLLEDKGVSCAVINPRFIKPLDTGTLDFFSRNVDAIATIEDHVATGGFGSIVAEELDRLNIAIPLVKMGWPDQFIEHGAIKLLREKHGLTAKATAEKLLAALEIARSALSVKHAAVA